MASVTTVKGEERRDEEKRNRSFTYERRSRRGLKMGGESYQKQIAYVSKIPCYLSEAFGIKTWHQNSFRVLLIALLNGTNGRHLPFTNSPLRWLLMGQSVQASEPSTGCQGWRNQFVASCWPVVSGCRPTLPGLLVPPLSLSTWKGTWWRLLWGDEGFCRSLPCHAGFALLKWERDQNTTVGSFALILSAGQQWMSAGQASGVKKRQRGLEHYVSVGSFSCRALSSPRKQSLRAGQDHKVRIMQFSIFFWKPDPMALFAHDNSSLTLSSLVPL